MAVVAKTDKMICPHCKIEMNHHCDKIVYNVEHFAARRISRARTSVCRGLARFVQ